MGEGSWQIVNSEQAETLALTALTHIAGDAQLLNKFLATSGLSGTELRAAAEAPEMLAGVLDFLLAHEPDLLAFCEAAGLAPEGPAAARRALPGAMPEM